MKRSMITAVLAAVLLLSFAVLTGCGKAEDNEAPVDLSLSGPVTVACMNGPTGMGLVDLMDNDDYDVRVYQSPTDAVPDIIKGDADIACVPSNLAAVLYNKTGGKIVCITPMVMGVLHILGNNVEIENIEELKGMTIVSSGQGGTPEYALKAVLSAHGMDMEKDVKVKWLASHADVNTLLLKEEGTVAMVPEPFVSTALTKGGDKIRSLFDMNTLWDEATSQDFPMGVLVTNKEFLTSRPDDLRIVLRDICASIDDVNTASEEAAQKIVDKGFLGDTEIAKKAIPNCSLCLYADQDGEHSMAKGAEIMKTFDKTMFTVDPAAVGGSLPGDDLYLSEIPEAGSADTDNK